MAKSYSMVVAPSVNPEVVVNHFHKGEVGAKIPMESNPVVGGSSFNIALACQRLGGSPLLIGAVAKSDPYRAMIRDELTGQRIAHSLLPLRSAPSLLITLVPEGCSLSQKPPIVALQQRNLEEVRRRLQGVDAPFWVASGIMDDANEIVLAKALWSRASQGSARVLGVNKSLMGNYEAFTQILSYVDILVMNHVEWMTYHWDRPINRSETALFHDQGPKIVIVTAAEEGAYLSTASGLWIHEPSYFGRVNGGELVDLTGAGDCLIATFLQTIGRLTLEEDMLRSAFRRACIAAALKLGKKGGSGSPTRDELDASIEAIGGLQ